MNKTLVFIFLLLLLSACSTKTSHVGDVHATKQGYEYSIKDTPKGFIVVGHYSEYQFFRNSRSGFCGCMQIINDAAQNYASSKNKEINLPRWDEIQIIDHGRDLITAVMNVNCQHEYKYIEPETNIVESLRKLKILYDTGGLTREEYQAAKTKVLSK